jgi:putative transposase
MPRRKIILTEGEIYHVFNRGVARMPIFTSPGEYIRFIELIEYCHFANTSISFSIYKKRSREQREEMMQTLYRENTLRVNILAFCLMPNHFHLVLQQITEHGISQFIGNIQNGYGKFFNLKHTRTGPVFQPSFQAVRIETDEQLLHGTRYVHLNPSSGFLVKEENLLTYKWSSLPGYLDINEAYPFVDTKIVMGLIGSPHAYRLFVNDQAEYQRELGMIKHMMLE